MVPSRAHASGLLAGLLLVGCGAGGGGGSDSLGAGVGDAQLAAHVLDRAAFGPSPAELDRLTVEGVEPWLAEQLHPETIDEDENQLLNALLAQLPVPQSEYELSSLDDLVRYNLSRALYSGRQLQEVLTDFWETHFTTNFGKVDAYFGDGGQTAAYLEFRENELLRANALGSFADMLAISATSPTMLIFLDNVTNVAGAPNENYARELVELHTLGVDNGYNEADIEEMARCFTGWTLCQVAPGDVDDPHAPCDASASARWTFHFDASRHDTSAKTVFAGSVHEIHFPARAGVAGILDGIGLIQHLALLPQTARFVSTKLARRLVSDDPPKVLIDACVDTWATTGGDLREVVRTILESPAFVEESLFKTKVKTPLEGMVSTVRALGGEATSASDLGLLQEHLDNLGQHPLFLWPDPDGYPEVATQLVGTSQVLDRFSFHVQLFEISSPIDFDLAGWIVAQGVNPTDVPGIVSLFFHQLFQDQLGPGERDLAIDFLNTLPDGESAPLDPLSPDYEIRIGLFAAFVASFPQSMEQ